MRPRPWRFMMGAADWAQRLAEADAGAGQQLLPTLNYAELPASLDASAKAQLNKITG